MNLIAHALDLFLINNTAEKVLELATIYVIRCSDMSFILRTRNCFLPFKNIRHEFVISLNYRGYFVLVLDLSWLKHCLGIVLLSCKYHYIFHLLWSNESGNGKKVVQIFDNIWQKFLSISLSSKDAGDVWVLIKCMKKNQVVAIRRIPGNKTWKSHVTRKNSLLISCVITYNKWIRI